MRLSYQIPLITGLTLLSTILVNIVAFESALQSLFPKYLERVNNESDISKIDNLDTLILVGKLDSKEQEEYKNVLTELTRLSTALKNIGENPELYISTGANQVSTDGSQNPSTKEKGGLINNRDIINIFLNPTTFSRNSAEGEFIISLITWMAWVNLFWIILILIVYAVWIRRVFQPIEFVIQKIENFIHNRELSSLLYKRNDEFFPLISAINNLHKSLSLQENIRSNFLADISHEIRTPITAVKLYLEAIEDGVMQLDAKMIALLGKELSRLIEITEKIMKYEQFSSSTFQDIRVERFNYTKLLTEITTEYQIQLEKTGQHITFPLAENTMTRMDKNMCIQILHNIFSNFIKYAGENTTLVCTYIKNENGYTVLRFSDDGKGIAKKDIEYVKEKFYRLDTGRTQKDGSMGIGLSIIDQIAKLHQGYFTIEENYPQGVSFSVYIKK